MLLSIAEVYSCWLQAVLSEHSAEVVGVALHPTNKYFITASADKSWAFYDLESMLCMAQVHNDYLMPAVVCVKAAQSCTQLGNMSNCFCSAKHVALFRAAVTVYVPLFLF